MSKLLIGLFLSLLSFNSFADYFITTYKSEIIDFNKPTRMMVAGQGDDLKLLFQQVAKAKAQKYSELNSEEQIVFITSKEDGMGNENALRRWGFVIHESNKATMDGQDFIAEVSRYKKILSLDIFSHSSAQFGIHLVGRANRLSINTRGLEVLKKNFLPGAFVYLHGCNSGFNLAPHLSKVWEVPVAGSLTSTNFQRLHTDGHYYLEEEGYAPSKDWSEKNEISYDQSFNCKDGLCLRLKPDNTPYYGFWGSYREGGLPFYKWFCVNNTAEQCSQVMAKSMLYQTSIVNLKKTSSVDDYKKAVIDYLCPVSSKKDLRRECEEQLDLALVTKDFSYNPFSKPQIECDFKSCLATVVCDKVLFTGLPKPGTCRLNNPATKATTLVREYISYMEAYSQLKN